MRHFKQIYFDGNGEQSKLRHELLRTILDEAISHLSGCQQPAHNYEDTEERKKAEKEITDAVKDISVALTGEERFTINEFHNYLKQQDSYGDIFYNLKAENVKEANQ